MPAKGAPPVKSVYAKQRRRAAGVIIPRSGPVCNHPPRGGKIPPALLRKKRNYGRIVFGEVWDSPEDKRIDLMAYGLGDQEAADAWLEELRAERYPEQERFSAAFITPDEQYGQMVLSTRVFAGEGDLYILPRTVFQTYASEGLFVPLEDLDGLADAFASRGISVERGWRRLSESSERHLYGVPVSALAPMRGWFLAADDLYLSLRVRTGNDETALQVLQDIVSRMLPAESVP